MDGYGRGLASRCARINQSSAERRIVNCKRRFRPEELRLKTASRPKEVGALIIWAFRLARERFEEVRCQ
jgi:hypothetical protein